jgi:hypothetical protein
MDDNLPNHSSPDKEINTQKNKNNTTLLDHMAPLWNPFSLIIFWAF